MKVASVSTLKNGLSAYLDLVRSGEVVLITDRGRPIARLVPLEPHVDLDPASRRDELERRGIIKRAEVPADAAHFESLPPPSKADGDVLQALLDERERGS
jgi:prevent-host-death family protein